jgi:hypothetical protein
MWYVLPLFVHFRDVLHVSSCRVNEWHEARSASFEGGSIATVYCSSTGASETTEWSAALHSILRQLAEVKGQTTLTGVIHDLYESRVKDRSSQAALSARELENILAKIFQKGVDTRIVLDALDECGGAETLLGVIKRAAEHHPGNLKLFCTSRVGINPESFFPKRILACSTATVTKANMRNFIREEIFSRDPTSRLLKGKHPNLEEELATAMVLRAGGM